MNDYLISSIFLLAFYSPLLLYSLFVKSIPKLKIQEAGSYLHAISELKPDFQVDHVDAEDMKKIKTQINHITVFMGLIIPVDILVIFVLVNTFKDHESAAYYLLIYIGAAILLSLLCIYICTRKLCIFQNFDDFSKRNGIILQYKVKYYRKRKPAIYWALIGTYDDNRNPIVIKTEIPSVVFHPMLKNEKWSVVMYKERPAAIIN